MYDVFTLADREQLFIDAISERQWDQLCSVLERPDLFEALVLRTNAQRVAIRPQVLARLSEILREHRIEELSAKLETAGLPYAPIARPDQLPEDPHLKASGGMVPIQTEDGGVAQTVLLPMSMNRRRLGVWRPLPAIGEHTDGILKNIVRR